MTLKKRTHFLFEINKRKNKIHFFFAYLTDLLFNLSQKIMGGTTGAGNKGVGGIEMRVQEIE